MVWGASTAWQQTPDGSQPIRIDEYFYIGREEEYHSAVSRNESRPFNESKSIKTSP
jgi:hypothetical protein